MSKRKYTKMDKYAAVIATMREEGRTRQEIADTLGLEYDQVANWIKRNNRKKRNLAQTLNELGIDGWHLVTAYSNELGKNALSGGAGGVMLGVNSTVDENILIFERYVKF